jgi:hypothetical protein
MDAASAAGSDRDAGAWTMRLVCCAALSDSIASAGGSGRANKPIKMPCIFNQTVYSLSWLHSFLHFGVFLGGRRTFEYIPRRRIF